jgi:hypothetical protein
MALFRKAPPPLPPIERIQAANLEDRAIGKRIALLEGEYAPAVQRRLAGFDGAKEIAADLHRELLQLGKRRGELRAIVAAAQAEMAAGAEDARRAAADRPALLAALGADRLQLAATIDAGLAALAETIKAFRQNSVDLSAAAGTPSNSGALSFDAALRCVRNVAAVAMEVEQGRPLTSQNSYLGLSNDAHGDDARLSAAETQQRALDDLAPFYLDLGQAQAAQMRRRERGDATVVAALAGGVFTLAPVARAFATREEAETALTVAGADLQVVDAVDGGAVLIGAELQAA